jgi:hypothetical protein
MNTVKKPIVECFCPSCEKRHSRYVPSRTCNEFNWHGKMILVQAWCKECEEEEVKRWNEFQRGRR